MAKRSEVFRANAQRHPSKQSKKRALEHAAKKSRLKRKLHGHANLHAAKKATFALEPRPPKGTRPSRKSSRKSANRSKFDTNFELRAERKTASPHSRHDRG
jgi:hypothetical protein